MRQLKSSLINLREIFERSITVRDIASPLCSFDSDCSAEIAKNFMDVKDYDVIGVRKDGLIHGYARKSDKIGGKIEDYLIGFDESEKFSDTTSLYQ